MEWENFVHILCTLFLIRRFSLKCGWYLNVTADDPIILASKEHYGSCQYHWHVIGTSSVHIRERRVYDTVLSGCPTKFQCSKALTGEKCIHHSFCQASNWNRQRHQHHLQRDARVSSCACSTGLMAAVVPFRPVSDGMKLPNVEVQRRQEAYQAAVEQGGQVGRRRSQSAPIASCQLRTTAA